MMVVAGFADQEFGVNSPILSSPKYTPYESAYHYLTGGVLTVMQGWDLPRVLMRGLH